MEWWQLVMVAVGFAVAAGLARRGSLQWRSGGIPAVIGPRGWRWKDRDPQLPGRWQGEPFGPRADGKAVHVVTGEHRGYPILAFDYTGTATAGRSGTTSVWGATGWLSSRPVYDVYVVELAGRVPTVELVPHPKVGRWARAGSGREGIRLGDEAFDRTFHTHCEDEVFARELLVPPVRRQLLAHTDRGYRFERDTLLSWAVGGLRAHTVVPRIDHLVDVVEAVPPAVWRRYGTTG